MFTVMIPCSASSLERQGSSAIYTGLSIYEGTARSGQPMVRRVKEKVEEIWGGVAHFRGDVSLEV